jgi:hypothetical protein
MMVVDMSIRSTGVIENQRMGILTRDAPKAKTTNDAESGPMAIAVAVPIAP